MFLQHIDHVVIPLQLPETLYIYIYIHIYIYIYIYIYYRLEEITPLITGVKSYIYTLLTGRNYAVCYWRKILQNTYYGLEEITPLITGVKSYRYTLPTGRNYAVCCKPTCEFNSGTICDNLVQQYK